MMPQRHRCRYAAVVELRQLRYALAVADELHFGRAARRLHMTQPSLSRQVRALEQEIGVDLFIRTGRGVELTPAGAEFAPQARRALGLVETAVRRTQEVGQGVTGHVSLGFVATAAIDILPRALAAHRAQHPGVVVTLAELTTEQQVGALSSGDLDVGLGRDVRPVPGLRIERLRQEPVVVALPVGHPLAGRVSLRLSDLAGWGVVKMPRERARHIDDLLRRIPGDAVGTVSGAAGPVVQEANQYMTLLALVAADMGVALVPDSVRPLRPTGMRYAALDEPDAATSLTVTTRAETAQPAADHLRSVLVAEFGGVGIPAASQ